MQKSSEFVISVTGYRYMIHFYCLAVEAGFYSDMVECLPVDPATRLGQVKYFCSTTMVPTVNNPSYDRSVHKYLPWSHFT